MKRQARARWTCPKCADTVLAPRVPRLDDVRRYCLPCSEEVGRLIKRAWPAMEKAKIDKAKRRNFSRRARTAELCRYPRRRAMLQTKLFHDIAVYEAEKLSNKKEAE